MTQATLSMMQDLVMTDPVPAEQPRPTPVPIVTRPARLRVAVPPTPLTSFIGRQREVERLLSLLRREDVRLVTLTGPGGVGKTRLALRVAQVIRDEYADGVRFVDLASVHDGERVPGHLAEALGVKAAIDQPPLAALAADLQDRRVLLVLDNLEQVIDGLLPLTKLLLTCPTVKLLATSRVRLRVSGEYVVVVPPLALPDPNEPLSFARMREIDAVRLFAARGEAARTTFVLSPDNAAAVATICRRLDALPLAIELAAARCDAATPAEVLARLQQRLPLLTDGPRDVPTRHQGMRAAIAWSYDLLSADEQARLARLAVFAGGFTLEAAAALSPVAHPAEDAFRGVSALLATSLLTRDDRTGAESRFRMLETIREFALERLSASGDEAAVRGRHAAYYLELAERIGPVQDGAALHAWLGQLEDDRANVRAALDWLLESGAVESLLRLVTALEEFWYHRGPISEGRTWSKRALAAADNYPISSTARLPALQVASLVAWMAGELETATVYAEESLVLARSLADDERTGWALNLLGLAAGPNHEQAAAYFDAALDVYRAAGIGRGPAIILMSRARVTDDGEHVRRLLNQALLLSRQGSASASERALVLNEVGRVALREQRYVEAGRAFAESLRLCWDTGDRWSFSQAVDGLANLARALGDSERAIRISRAIAASREDTGTDDTEAAVVPAVPAPLAESVVQVAPAFAAPWSVVRELPVKDAVAEALSFAAELETSAAPDPVATEVVAFGGLSPRELEVLRLIAEGFSDRAIAARLSVTYRTTTTYVTSILNKLGVSSRTAAVAHAHREGFL
jgi:non-specific serine/threonine protein kinase